MRQAQSRRRRERRGYVCVCVFTCAICNIKYIVHIYINVTIRVLAFQGHLYQPWLPCFLDKLATACVSLMLAAMHFRTILSC